MNQRSKKPLRHLIVEGPIGVGKSSLAQKVSESLGAELLLEGAEENPFLEQFYREGRKSALPTQLYFLFQRARQLQVLRQDDLFKPKAVVADFMLEKDRLFAQVNLNQDELALYDKVYETLDPESPRPDLVVYLQAPANVLQQRIRHRDRPLERAIDLDYLQQLCDAYTHFFYHYDRSPLLIVNAAEINPIDREEDYQLLLEQICNARSGKHYFNPGSLLF